MSKDILVWEAQQIVEEALTDGLSDEQLQSILDIIYGNNMFRIVNTEELKKTLFEDKVVLNVLNKNNIGF